MESFFTACAVIGGIVFLGQFALNLLGAGDSDVDGLPDVDVADAEVPIDIDGGTTIEHSAGEDLRFVGMFSLRAILAGITVFGLTGLAGAGRFGDLERVLMSLGAGLGTMYLMGLLVRLLHGMEHDGTVRLQDALGATGTVYLSIPGERKGAGKVTVNVKGRTMEYQALTDAAALASGTPVEVVGLIPPDTVEVRLLEEVRTPS